MSHTYIKKSLIIKGIYPTQQKSLLGNHHRCPLDVGSWLDWGYHDVAILYTTRTKERAQRLVTTGCWHPLLGLFCIKVSDLLNPYIYIYTECMSYMLCMNNFTHRTVVLEPCEACLFVY